MRLNKKKKTQAIPSDVNALLMDYRRKHDFAWFFRMKFVRHWRLWLMVLFPLAYLILFAFVPMYGIQIAFKNYRPRLGIWGSPWVGIEQFQHFFSNYKWGQYVLNTLTISLYSILVGFPIPIFLALCLHVNEHKGLKKFTQNLSYLPHFISVVVMVGILNQIFSPISGLYAMVTQLFHLPLKDLRSDPGAFYHLFVWSSVWQNMGWSAIMYVAALSAVPQELHEAAMLDGASRWRRVIHVDLPTILPTVCMMLILRFGSIMEVGYEKAYLMQYPTNLEKSEIISTYVFKNGVASAQYSYGTAVDLMNSVITLLLVLLVNWVTNKLSDGEHGLF